MKLKMRKFTGVCILAIVLTGFCQQAMAAGGGCLACWWFDTVPYCVYSSGYDTSCTIRRISRELFCIERSAPCGDPDPQ